MVRRRALLTAAILFGLTARTVAVPAMAEELDFVAMGDMPYSVPGDYPKLERLLGAVNAAGPDFVVHVGDIKGGGTPCTDAVFATVRDYFQTIDAPVVYTPGDNEWTDCHRKAAGAMDPLERLATLRRMFFSEPRSLGRTPIALTRQADITARTDYVENSRFQMAGVTVVLAHVVGSNNNFETRDPTAVAEFFARDAATSAWIADGFRSAVEDGSRALVLALHADLFEGGDGSGWIPRQSGFQATIAAIRNGAKAFRKPVLVIHGDWHVFKIDQPFRDTDGARLDNVTRLEVFGASDVHAVRVTVDDNGFGFVPLWGPGNRANISDDGHN